MRREWRQDEYRKESARSGSVTLEFIIAFPIVFIATLAIAQFFFLILIIEGASTALHEGTRQGAEAYPTGTSISDIADDIVAVMNQHLNVYKLEIADGSDDTTKQNATVTINLNRSGVTSNETRPVANPDCTPIGPAPDTDEIVVTLCFKIADSSEGDDPVPNWLTGFGFTLEDIEFEMTARASLE